MCSGQGEANHPNGLVFCNAARYPRGNGLGVDLASQGITKDLKGTPMEGNANNLILHAFDPGGIIPPQKGT